MPFGQCPRFFPAQTLCHRRRLATLARFATRERSGNRAAAGGIQCPKRPRSRRRPERQRQRHRGDVPRARPAHTTSGRRAPTPRPARRGSPASSSCSTTSRRRRGRSSTRTGATRRRPRSRSPAARDDEARPLRTHERKIEYRLHRVSDWVTDQDDEIADLLHDWDILGIKAASEPRGRPRAVVMQWLLLVDSHLLGFLERYRTSRATRPCAAALRRATARRAARIEDYYLRAGEKRARMRYVAGWSLGGVPTLAAARGAARRSCSRSSMRRAQDRQRPASSTSRGCRRRRRGDQRADAHERARASRSTTSSAAGSDARRRVPSVDRLRLGRRLYFLVQTPLLPIEPDARTLPFYVVLAFLAGFSERWTQVALTGAMRTIGEHGDRSSDTVTSTAAPQPSDIATVEQDGPRVPTGAAPG